MEAWNTVVKKCLVILLTTTYFFVAIVYLIYLPKFSRLRINGNYTPADSQIMVKSFHQVKNIGSNVLALIHRAYKSTVENKRRMFSKLLQTGVVFVFIIMGGALLEEKPMPFTARAVKSHGQRQYAYLSYGTLRI